MENKDKKPKSKARKIIEWVVTGVIICLFALVAIGQILGIANRGNNNGQTLSFGVYGNFIVLTDSMEPEYEKQTAIITKKMSLDKLYELYQENCEYNKPIQEKYSAQITAATTTEEKTNLILAMEKEEKHIDITFVDNYANYASVKPSKDTSDPILNNLDSPVQVSTTEVSVMTHRLREMRVDESVSEGNGRYTFITSGTNIGGHYSQFGQYQAFTEAQYLGMVMINSPFLGGFFQFVSSVWGLLILLLIPALYLIITAVMDIVKALKEKDEEEELVTQQGKDNTTTPSANSSLSNLSKEDQERLKKEMLDEMLNNSKKDK
jgi:hypothetical protein